VGHVASVALSLDFPQVGRFVTTACGDRFRGITRCFRETNRVGALLWLPVRSHLIESLGQFGRCVDRGGIVCGLLNRRERGQHGPHPSLILRIDLGGKRHYKQARNPD